MIFLAMVSDDGTTQSRVGLGNRYNDELTSWKRDAVLLLPGTMLPATGVLVTRMFTESLAILVTKSRCAVTVF